MFEIETEDMLPRMAPKPSDSASMCLDEAAIRPQVPEVSLLFGQQQSHQEQQQHHQHQHQTPPAPSTPHSVKSVVGETVAVQNPLQQQTYAAWKKKIMPKISYPSCKQDMPPSALPIIESSATNMPCNHGPPSTKIYPIRQTCASVPLLPLAHPMYCYTNPTPQPAQFHHNADNANIHGQVHAQHLMQTKMNANCPPSKNDILTICAGTQTDSIGECPPLTSLSNAKCCLMDKTNAEQLFQMLYEIRGEQIRMIEIVKTLLANQEQSSHHKPLKKHAFSQTEEVLTNDCYYPRIEIQNAQPAMEIENKFLNHLLPKSSSAGFVSPKTKPAAQSTGYRANSPQTKQLVEQINSNKVNYPSSSAKASIVIPPATSEKSMLMNELALKYLPNEKLTQLLQELNINVPYMNDVKQVALDGELVDDQHHDFHLPKNFEKSPVDISRASYKYLKKYRLLPEDNGHAVENQQLLIDEYDRNPGRLSPAASKTKSSPYQPAAIVRQQTAAIAKANGMSPLSSSSSASASASSHSNSDDRIDLDDIKQQPKYL